MDPKNSIGPDRIDYQENPGDLTEVHAAIQREHRDPTAATTPIPLWLSGVCVVALTWGATYFGVFHGGFRPDVFNERLSSPDMLFPQKVSATAKPEGEAGPGPSLAAAGKAVYANCVPCHGPGGLGIPGQFPTLVGTEYVKSEKRMIALLLKGIQGPMNVGGQQYNGQMPAWEGTLSNKKIAQVASYVRASFGNAFPEISEAKVAAGRKEFAAQSAQWNEAQLLAMSADVGVADAPVAAAAPAPAAGAPPAATAAAAPGAPAAAPAGATAPAPPAAAPAAPAKDLMALGKAQYLLVCAACHQPTGLGLPPVFPPLAKTEYTMGDPKRVVAIILKGVMGPLTVEGKVYNQIMVAQEATMTNEKIAAVATYVRSSFGNTASAVTPEMVAEVRKQYAGRTTAWTEAELKAFGGEAPAAPAAGGAPAPGAPAPASAAPAPAPNATPTTPAAPADAPAP